MTLEPARRSYSETPPESRLKDVDAAGRAQAIHAMGWSLFGGVPLGIALGLLLGVPLLGLFLGPVLMYLVVSAVAGVAGRGAGKVYMPSGSSTPRKKEYSRAMALEVQGQLFEAVKAYEMEVLDNPADPEPYLRIARLQRDSIRDPGAAAHWFKRAQREAVLSPGQTIRTHRELAELFIHTLKEPRKAAPELARLAELFPNTQDGGWAARTLAELKEEMARELMEEGGESMDPAAPDPGEEPPPDVTRAFRQPPP